jgi:uncharacterized coiled-coil protein SlyX
MALFGPKKAPTPPATVEKDPTEARFDALGAQIGAMEGLLKANQAQNTRVNTLLASVLARAGGAPERVNGPIAPKPPVVDLAGLPDPVEDRDGFSKALNERLVGAFTAAIDGLNRTLDNRQAAGADTKAQLDELSENFDAAYPDLVDHADAVAEASRKVFTKLKRRGVDPMAYITQDEDGFMEAVAVQANTIIAKAAKKAEATAEPEADDTGSGDDDNRMLVLGGDATVDLKLGTKPPMTKPEGSMFADLIAEQKRLRIR